MRQQTGNTRHAWTRPQAKDTILATACAKLPQLLCHYHEPPVHYLHSPIKIISLSLLLILGCVIKSQPMCSAYKCMQQSRQQACKAGIILTQPEKKMSESPA